MELTYYGQSCFSVTIKGKKILFDPFITPNELAKDIDVSSIEADYILVSHGHQDHVYDLVDIAKRTGAKVVTNFEIMSWLGDQGIENVHPMNHGGKWDFEFGTVKYVNAIHSSMLPDGSNGGNPGGFVIMSDEGNFYFAGDTALTVDMQLIPRIAKLDFALLPIGDNFTMGVDDAIVAADFIDCQKIMGVHYDTFGFIEIDHEEAKRKFKEAGLELHLLDIGETRDL
ncbi:MAG: metal-dependent hydrolase [Bacteroidetes bacterium SW_11_45_7]|nr:MAG: metal-dependent hydrolase [Bacteroidetes bacterium SW_11_45_7]